MARLLNENRRSLVDRRGVIGRQGGRSTVRDALKRLLEAEEDGRRRARALEAEGQRVVQSARLRAAEILAESRQEVERSIARLEEETSGRASVECRAIEAKARRVIDELERVIPGRRREAMERVVVLLLGEEPQDEAGG
jgi:hypothetical protein